MGEGVLSDAFQYGGDARDTLHCEGVSLDALAAQMGTPLYVYSTAMLAERVRVLATALSAVKHRIHYACKANSNLGLLALLRALGVQIDVVSGGELYRARTAGFAPGQIIFGGVGKTGTELAEALDAGVELISVESGDEATLVGDLAAARGIVAPLGIRVNPEITVASFHEYIKTGEKGDKFGIPMDQVEAVAQAIHAHPHLSLVSVGMHIGSQVTDFAAFAAALAKLESLVARLRAAGVHTIRYLDAGGGIFVPYEGEAHADVQAFAGIVSAAALRLRLELVVEPGRFLVAESGVLLTRVLYRKRSGGRDIVIVDAAMNDLLRPSHYDAYHQIDPVRRASPGAASEAVDVVGPICESGDFLALDRVLPVCRVGDLLCVRTAGAYGSAMASNYNARPRAAEVLVRGRDVALITARESYEDLVRRERAHVPWVRLTRET